MEDLYIIDGMALAYRGYYAFVRSPLKNSRGQNTSAVFVFLSALLKLALEEKAGQMVVVFDADKETFRHRLYKAYKANRPPMPEDLKTQIPLILDLLKAMNIPVIREPGVEADDIIGTLAVRTANRGGRAYILSKDKDFAQLVSDNIILVDPKMHGEKTARMDARAVRGKFGVDPAQMVDYLSLTGDASDNIPGVAKVGPKTAADLINTYGGLDALYASLAKIKKEGLRKNLTENRENAYLSQNLVTIRTDVPIDDKTFGFGPIFSNAYAALLKDLEFTQYLRQFAERTGGAQKAGPADYSTADTKKALEAFVKKARRAQCLALDTETTSLDVHSAGLAGISLSIREAEAVYVPLGHARGKNLDMAEARRLLTPLFSDPKIRKAGHNLKFDLAVLARHGLAVAGPLFDTMVAAYVLNPGTRQYALDLCVMAAFSHAMQPITALIGEKKKDQIPFSEVEIEKASPYSCADADYALRLAAVYEKELAQKGLQKLFDDIEMPLLAVLLAMEDAGVKIDAPFLKELSAEYEKILGNLHKRIIGAAGREFNINSPKQLAEVLFSDLGIKPLKKGKTGFSTDAGVLEVLAAEHELPRLILEHREYSKLKSTYVDALPGATDKNGLVHTSFNQTITATGRLSSSSPNLQNIPVRTETGREIRKSFVPRKKGNVLVSADYSQIELRILAHISAEEALIEAFNHDEDIHRKTAGLILNVMPAMVSDADRAMAKTVNFGIIYGQSAFGLSRQIGISQKAAARFIDNYFQCYPKIREYMDATIRSARERGYVETLYGRRRALPDIKSPNHAVRQFAERTAINTPIQGTAADLIKIAMIRIHRKIVKKEINALLLLQVHDELVFEAPKREAGAVIQAVKKEMEGAAAFRVPLKVEAGSGENWLEAH